VFYMTGGPRDLMPYIPTLSKPKCKGKNIQRLPPSYSRLSKPGCYCRPQPNTLLAPKARYKLIPARVARGDAPDPLFREADLPA
jgi:hypothetical protein